ncbi:hypothetical protein [Paenibacillus spongiae]|uniref:Uncharacterized protein n=1 Tax=Paenibacillus spongiae TaxID=2909671 RepID=A0ABY5SGX0_9BACL|nr:hypothetical protein [Paenibacillus spongiae]UVI33246.1 hypothetical protein L1F29_15990 [Paenibacillus spongiae]
MKTDKNSQFVVYIIKGSTIKRFLILDLIVGTGIFYVVKFVLSSVLIASVGSIVGTEGIKRAPKIIKKWNGIVPKKR